MNTYRFIFAIRSLWKHKSFSLISLAGLLLLRKVDKQMGLIDRKSIADNRDQRYVDLTVLELITQLVFQITASYEDCNDFDDLRDGIIFKFCEAAPRKQAQLWPSSHDETPRELFWRQGFLSH